MPSEAEPLRWVSPITPADEAELRGLGMVEVRRLHQMRRSLPLPDELVATTRDIQTRPFRPGDDDSEWLGVNNRAFSWHPDQGGWDAARLRDRLAEPWVDLDGFLVHDGEDGHLDGFCWTKVHPAADGDPAMGEIFVIAADPSTRGTGLGRALTVAGLSHLSALGLDVGMLYVEADNVAAVALYERLGFRVHHSDAAFAPTRS
ncbi:MAG: mycothiol synthase [Microthrixaceae bacterium]